MKRASLVASLLLLFVAFAARVPAQVDDASRFRALREKIRNGMPLSAAEQAEFDKLTQARSTGRTATPPRNRPTTDRPTTGRPTTTPSGTRPTPSAMGRDAALTGDRAALRAGGAAAAADRKATYHARQGESMARMRQYGDEALKAAAARQAPTGPARQYYVNNELGDDAANGLSATKNTAGAPVKTLVKAVSLLQPGDTLHLAVTNEPYRETLRLGDNFGGVPGKPITIDGHGATITGCDPLRIESWQPSGAPGLYKSATFLSELEEFGDPAKLGRVYLVFDGVAQHMGRSMKGAKAHFKAPGDLQPGEWTYSAAEQTFYIKVSGSLADAKVEAPYRRNGLAVRAPKVAATHFVVKNLIVCRVLNDGYNLHGATKDVLLQNIAALECGDDGISPHETCEVEIDGFWSVGNSTGMANGNLSTTKARNVRLEGNLGHQLMTGHSPVTELTNAIIIGTPGTQPINISNSQDTRLKMDNVLIASPAGQKNVIIPHTTIDATRLTVWGPTWEIAGKVNVSTSVIGGGSFVFLEGGSWTGGKNVFDSASGPPAGDVGSTLKSLTADVLKSSGPPVPGAGANPAEFQIPPKPVPHPKAGKFDVTDRSPS